MNDDKRELLVSDYMGRPVDRQRLHDARQEVVETIIVAPRVSTGPYSWATAGRPAPMPISWGSPPRPSPRPP